MLDNEEIAGRIRIRRTALRMTQETLAKKLEIYKNSVDHWESGSKVLSVEDIQKVAQALDVPVSYFFPDSPDDKGSKPEARYLPVIDELRIAASHELLTPEVVEDAARYIRFRVDEAARAWGVETSPSEIEADRREQIYLQEKAKRERLLPAQPAAGPEWRPPPGAGPEWRPPPGAGPEWRPPPGPAPKREFTRGDRITAGMAVAGALAILGVWAVNRASSRTATGNAARRTGTPGSGDIYAAANPEAATAATAMALNSPTMSGLHAISETMKRQYGWVVLEGKVQNDSRQQLSGAQALTTFSDARHHPIAQSTALVKDDLLPPGSQSTYTVYVKDNPLIVSYKTTFHMVGASSAGVASATAHHGPRHRKPRHHKR